MASACPAVEREDLGLLGLTDDSLHLVLDLLPVATIARLAGCCRRLRDLIAHDPIWQRLVVRQHGSKHAAGWPERAKASYGVGSYRALLRVLNTVGDLEGTWRLASPDAMPQGGLIGVVITPGRITLDALVPRGHVPPGEPIGIGLQRQDYMTIRFHPTTGAINGFCDADVQLPAGDMESAETLIAESTATLVPGDSAAAAAAADADADADADVYFSGAAVAAPRGVGYMARLRQLLSFRSDSAKPGLVTMASVTMLRPSIAPTASLRAGSTVTAMLSVPGPAAAVDATLPEDRSRRCDRLDQTLMAKLTDGASAAFACSDRGIAGAPVDYVVVMADSLPQIEVLERIAHGDPADAGLGDVPRPLRGVFAPFWLSLYGNHGLEIFTIIYVSPDRPSDRDFNFRNLTLWPVESPDDTARSGVEASRPGVRRGKLLGLKVKGDPNVPSGRASFVFDLPAELPDEPTAAMDTRSGAEVTTSPAWAIDAAQAVSHIQLNMNLPPGHWNSWWESAGLLIRSDAGHISLREQSWQMNMNYYPAILPVDRTHPTGDLGGQDGR